ncbi:MAG TPA: tetratricopeptide repeat protein [Thermoanaerobaculia bacterium]|nr:tetratricopeptide repeat protein [Thermoanaerobaculia bacterium]
MIRHSETTGRRPLPAALALLCALALFALATAEASAQAATDPAPPAASATQLSAAGERAMALLDSGDRQGAIAALEAVDFAGLTPVERGLLGALYVEADRAADAWRVLGPMAAEPGANAAVLYNAGRAALGTGETQRAAELLQRSVALMPVSPAARELGLLLGASGRRVAAYAVLRPWAEAHPEDTEARTAAAALALQLSRPAEAARLLEALPEGDPRVTLLRGQLKMQQGDPHNGLTILEALYADHPPEMDADVRRLLADAYVQVGRSADAIPLLEGRADRPAQALLLAEARYRTGDLAGALATLQPLAQPVLGEAEPGEHSFRLALDYGRMLVASGRHAEALPYLQLAVALDDSEQLAWKTLGDAYAATGERDKAKEALERFRSLVVSQTERRAQAETAAADAGAGTLLEAMKFLEAGKPERALPLVRREIALSPHDLRPRLMEVRLLIALERREEAAAAADRTLAQFAGSPDALYQRGLTRMLLKQPGPAEEDFRQVLAMAPDHVATMNDLAVLLMLQGKRDEALRLVRRVLELRPEDPLATQNLRRMEGDGTAP